MQFALSSKALVEPLSVERILQQECKVPTYQDRYFICRSIDEATEALT